MAQRRALASGPQEFACACLLCVCVCAAPLVDDVNGDDRHGGRCSGAHAHIRMYRIVGDGSRGATAASRQARRLEGMHLWWGRKYSRNTAEPCVRAGHSTLGWRAGETEAML